MGALAKILNGKNIISIQHITTFVIIRYFQYNKGQDQPTSLLF